VNISHLIDVVNYYLRIVAEHGRAMFQELKVHFKETVPPAVVFRMYDTGN
jgi:hypothetical protein